ncbi:hypothetical protein DL766_002342 [Monosporascus sp. MC13-8B]|uniref:L-ascorbate oxidase n=1 Tax=Monosporascus cannonballus TaxID=155416 RepID=A0ABY0H1Z3_9PEZI|nr:hypothetical protein DL762_006465 [Monosporascus cannonballus]RYO86611.1 hypothetical protein DL763_006632 [Monosporascus cannonballus]RYP35782.1 hypothetical protein DL766_002342 [Monosporascus sp. MC13-8B]
MRTAPFSDGTPLVTQWPIPPGHFFDYEIRPEVGDAGTYIYHSHSGFQAVTAHGQLIVREAEKHPYQYDDEIAILVADWYTKTDSEIESALTSDPFIWPGEPEALILNGRSGIQSLGNASHDSCMPSVITVIPGMTYRVRFASLAALSFTILEIEGHTDLTVIEADGRYMKPAKTDRIQLGSGQRFSILLTTKSPSELAADGKGGEYWINYRTPDGPRGNYLSGKALLKYGTWNSTQLYGKSGRQFCRKYGKPFHRKRAYPGVHNRHDRHDRHGRHPTAPPHPKVPGKPAVSVKNAWTTWLEYTLEPLDTSLSFPTLDEVTRTLHVNLTMDDKDGGQLKFKLNDLAWNEASFQQRPGAIPYLIDAYVNQRSPDYDAAIANNGWDPKSWGFPVRVGEVIDIVWQQTNIDARRSYEYHPLHAHGQRFWDLGSGSGEYDPVANEQRFANYTPAPRDTTILYSYNGDGNATTSAWRAWRYRVTEENIGAWLMHCHLLHHMVMGMQSAWFFGDATEILRNLPHPYISGYLEYGGSAYGNSTYDPFVLSYFD